MQGKKPGFLRGRALSNLVVVCVGVLLFMLLSNFSAVAEALGWFFSIFRPFVAAMGVAWLLNMPMRFFERRFFHRVRRKRALSILLTYLVAVLLLGVLLGLVIPQVVDSVSLLLRNLALYMDNFNDLVQTLGAGAGIAAKTLDSFMLSYNDIMEQVLDWVRGALPDLVNYGGQVVSGLVGFFTAIIASVYMLFSKEKLIMQSKRVLHAFASKAHAAEALRILRLSNGVFSGFISGKLLDSAIIGLICFVFMSVMNILSSILGISSIAMPYAPLISVVVGVTNIIPFFGPFIGAIPSGMILLMIDPWNALWFTVFIIVLQQFDGNVLGPKILGDSTGLPAMWVLIAIIVGGGLFGFMGMLLGVPTTAVLYTLGSDIIENRLRRRGLADNASLASARGGPAPPPFAHEGETAPAAPKDGEAGETPEDSGAE